LAAAQRPYATARRCASVAASGLRVALAGRHVARFCLALHGSFARQDREGEETAAA